jgi:hypothetical protein
MLKINYWKYVNCAISHIFLEYHGDTINVNYIFPIYRDISKCCFLICNFTVTWHCDFYRSCSNDVYLNQSHLSIRLLSLFTVFLGIIYYKQVHNISSLKNKKNNYFMPLIPSRINTVTLLCIGIDYYFCHSEQMLWQILYLFMITHLIYSIKSVTF